MCKKNQPGCIGCCKPVLDRIDPFDNWWKCWKTREFSSGLYITKVPWDIETGQAVKHFVSSTDSLNGPAIDLVRMPPPFSVDITLTFLNLKPSGTGFVSLNCLFNEQILRGFSLLNMGANFGFANSPGANASSIVFRVDAPPVQFGSEILGTVAYPFTIRYRAQFDNDGATHWALINGVAPTVNSGAVENTPFGVKQTGTLAATLNTGTNAKSNLRIQLGASNFSHSVGDEIARIDNLEFHKWNHTVTTRSWP